MFCLLTKKNSSQLRLLHHRLTCRTKIPTIQFVKHLETIIISTIIFAVTKQCGSDAATIELILKLFFSLALGFNQK